MHVILKLPSFQVSSVFPSADTPETIFFSHIYPYLPPKISPAPTSHLLSSLQTPKMVFSPPPTPSNTWARNLSTLSYLLRKLHSRTYDTKPHFAPAKFNNFCDLKFYLSHLPFHFRTSAAAR